ncbi:MAG: bifunctional phosphoribosylaminoimidazolecarboxamide formyltransferase/IMP cyclohydrolase [Parvularculaceae bacterium]
MTDDIAPVRRALLSVSDKAGVADLARRLAAAGVELVSTGGTAALLREAGLAVRDVSELTGFPEIMDGRVKTLHPGVHGGLLAKRDDAAHQSALEAHGLSEIDVLAVNLYPFEETAARCARGEVDEAACIENIDIGGPAMIRAAAKNAAAVGVLVDPDDYDAVLSEVEATGGLSSGLRQRLAATAFARVAAYDAAIAEWQAARLGDAAPRRVARAGRLRAQLRYGENPHQTAAFYASGEDRPGVASARQVQGKELSYNNLNDADAAFELVADLPPARPAVAIIKHANPCGVASGDDLAAAYDRAHKCDPVSAFGGVVAFSRPIDAGAARRVGDIFTEVVIAPGADEEALSILGAKKNLRVLLTDRLPEPLASGSLLRPVAGGFLVQSRDAVQVAADDMKVVSKRAPTTDELRDLVFAFRVAKHVKSNAIVYVKDEATVGVGAGQMSRVDAARIAARKAADAADAAGESAPLTTGSVVASDAFFPFADGLLAAAEAGATAVVQPGGSKRDDEVIAAADEAGIAMVFTGVRHFRH